MAHNRHKGIRSLIPKRRRHRRHERAPDPVLPTLEHLQRRAEALGIPIEAVDSSRIAEAAKALFSAGSWPMTGGAIYALTLNDIIGNFERLPDGERWLQWCLAIDDLLSDMDEHHCGVFISPKSPGSVQAHYPDRRAQRHSFRA